ncbi:speedy protein A [Genypterus blacodes]|uniref:speedy protein A n=1 Tax=Genypterus blacodes TaxID=154954 RepID=UPI003F7627A3
MKKTLLDCLTPAPAPVRVQSTMSRPVCARRSLQLKRSREREDGQGPPGKSKPGQNQNQNLLSHAKHSPVPMLVIQQKEMKAYLRMFDDEVIKDFLCMDCCCKMTDKYLLAMTFVYFKRACFTVTEYNRRNFFIGLYLANTMEEDEEEVKYEIFPWALGRTWRRHFPHFLKQRDKLWARIQYRAAVSRRCCEEVMAIVPSHFVWQRQRAEHHGGAQRQYGDQDRPPAPRGPWASPKPCALCDRGSAARLSSASRGFSASAPTFTSPLPFAFSLTVEKTPPRAKASQRSLLEARQQPQFFSCFLAANEQNPRKDSCDTALDWINEV